MADLIEENKKVIDAGSYRIAVERNTVGSFGEYLRDEAGLCRVLLVSDDRVYSIYGKKVRDSLISAGYECAKDFVFPHGEASKNLDTLTMILRHAAKEKLTRRDMIIALGGGVTGDMAGFASAVYLRGIKYASCPTSLLSMVDSSVGGKTAVDIPEGKNLVGAFHQPSFVLTDPDVLSTLPDEFVSDGMAEVIKYGVLGNRELFELLEATDGLNEIDGIIASCIKDKRDIVAVDPTDKGVRAKLNLGHTMGHGIELLSDFTVSHGHAVASGMYLIMKASVRNGLCGADDLVRLEALLKKFGLDPYLYRRFDFNELIEAASHDKKKSGSKITLVVPCGIGKCDLMPMEFEEMSDFMRAGFDR